MLAVKTRKSRATEKFSRLLKWKAWRRRVLFPVTGAIFANGTVSVPFSCRALLRVGHVDHVHTEEQRKEGGDRRVTLYVSYSEMFMRPVQRPITKMTIKINYSHHVAIAMACWTPITPSRLARCANTWRGNSRQYESIYVNNRESTQLALGPPTMGKFAPPDTWHWPLNRTHYGCTCELEISKLKRTVLRKYFEGVYSIKKIYKSHLRFVIKNYRE